MNFNGIIVGAAVLLFVENAHLLLQENGQMPGDITADPSAQSYSEWTSKKGGVPLKASLETFRIPLGK